ncbi:MAG: type IV pilin protein, partial [Planctomycetota bacterium]
MRDRKMKKNGFTLVELMIVVTILGILAAIVIPEFQG